jgi:hypothetical protein
MKSRKTNYQSEKKIAIWMEIEFDRKKLKDDEIVLKNQFKKLSQIK